MRRRASGWILLAALALAAVGAGAWLAGAGPIPQAQAAARYTCPMHPEVIEDAPGRCPLCGMNLVPLAEATPEPAPTPAPPARPGPRPAPPATPPPTHPPAHVHDEADPPPRADAAPTLYTCGMHPQVIQDHPGTCPICGMDLVPMSTATAGGSSNTLTIDPVLVQNMGVRVAPAQRATLWRDIRAVGEVAAPEDALAVVNLRFSGWVEALHVDTTGARVERGQPLMRVYAPEVVAAQEEYLLARAAGGPESALARAAERRLSLMGVPAAHLAKVVETGDGQRTLTILSPVSGHVLEKRVVEGARVKVGEDLYRIADLSRVWVEVEVYAFDAPYVFVGQEATVQLGPTGGPQREARVEYVYPDLDAHTRALRARLSLPNDQGALKLGTFATVRLKAQTREGVVAIPGEAILRTGQRDLVFVSPQPGHYEAREVEVGLVGEEGLTEIIKGVAAGETVVTSGQFLLDSEAQLREAVQKLVGDRLQVKPGVGAKP